VVGRLPDGRPDDIAAPMIPLLDTTLLTNAPGEPRVGNQILTETRWMSAVPAKLVKDLATRQFAIGAADQRGWWC
jgi:hypothetical protein